MKREYTVPLRSSFRNTEHYNKTKRAVSALQTFMRRHMKTETVKLGASVNDALWHHGGRNPPHHVNVVCEKNDEGVVYVELEGHKLPSELAAEAEAKEKKAAKKKTAEQATKKDEESADTQKPVAKKATAEKPANKPDAATKKSSVN